MATFRDKQLVATRWYGRPTLGELYVNPAGSDASIKTMASAMYGARLITAAKYATGVFILLTVLGYAYLNALGLWALTGVIVFGLVWFITSRRMKKLASGLKIGDIRGGDIDDMVGFSRLNVVLDDAVRGEEAGTVDEQTRNEISGILSKLPGRFDYKEAERASRQVQDILDSRSEAPSGS